MKAKALIALCLTVCLLCGSALAGGLDGLNQVLGGYWQEGGSFTLSAQVQTLIPYVDSKVEMFNKLLNHLSVQAAADASATSVSLCVDGQTVASLTETQLSGGSSLTTPLLPNRTLVSGGSALDALTGEGGQEDAFDFFTAVSQAQDCYQALTDAIAPYAEEKKANYKIKNVGSAKWSRIARLTKEQSAELAPRIAAVLSCGMDSQYRQLIESLTYGKSFIVGLYKTAQDGDDIAVYMKGSVTVPGVGTRSLSFQWAFSQDDSGKRVDSWKFELGKGRKGGREVYGTITRQTGNSFLLKGESEVTVRNDDANTAYTCTYDLSGKDGAVEGKAVFTEKTTDQAAVETRYQPKLSQSSGGVDGSVQVTRKVGKDTYLDYTLQFTGSPAEGGEATSYQVGDEPQVTLTESSLDQTDEETETPEYLVGSAPVGVTAYQAPATMQTVDLDTATQEQRDALLGEISQNLAGRLLKALAKAPREDLALLYDNMSDEDFDAFLQLVP